MFNILVVFSILKDALLVMQCFTIFVNALSFLGEPVMYIYKLWMSCTNVNVRQDVLNVGALEFVSFFSVKAE